MQYVLLLKPLPNGHHYLTEKKLAKEELRCLLSPYGDILEDVHFQDINENEFLVFSLSEENEKAMNAISMHSSICLFAEFLSDNLLRPLPLYANGALPEELPHILKYKGKTNVDFTRMMILCALSLSRFSFSDSIRLLDPMCGKATTLFCGAVYGMDAFGLDVDRKELQEADTFFEKFLQMNRIKHQREQKGYTLHNGSVRTIEYKFSKTKDDWKTSPHQLFFMESDLRYSAELFHKEPFHLIVSDLPYGIQHAPHENKQMSSLMDLASSLAKVSFPCLKPGGVAAFSFNQNTLPSGFFSDKLREAGFTILNEEYHMDFSHWLEQAIVRNVLFVRKDQ